jgi:hypothetical protein
VQKDIEALEFRICPLGEHLVEAFTVQFHSLGEPSLHLLVLPSHSEGPAKIIRGRLLPAPRSGISLLPADCVGSL